jgi:DNA polymerase-3 subunit beta
MPHFILDAAHFVAINKYAASTEATRYYLNGVCIEVLDGKGVMVATDGHKLLVAPFDPGATENGSYIIPSKLIANIKIVKKGEKNLSVHIGPQTVELEYNGTRFVGQLIDGSFPDWRRVIPKEQSGEYAQFNGSYMKELDDAARMIGLSRAQVGMNGQAPAWVSYASETLFGVLMPMIGTKTVLPTRPDWI